MTRPSRETICPENPSTECSFQTVFYPKGTERSSVGLEQHVLMFCQKGHIRITSNLFKEEFLCEGEILFIPRGSDYHGVALSETTLLMKMCRSKALFWRITARRNIPTS